MSTTLSPDSHAQLAPSSWVTRSATHIPAGGRVLDLACGSGRHARWLAKAGYNVDAVDRDLSGFVDAPLSVKLLVADLEDGSWRVAPNSYAGVVVTNYLHRPLFPMLLDSLIDGGVLIVETFALGNERYGRPSRPEFLLKRGELLEAVRGVCDVIAFEDLTVTEPKPAVVQRIAATRRR